MDLADNTLSQASGAMKDLLDGVTIPNPIQKNLFKVCGQLFTAVADIPISYLEGIAVEKRAKTGARVKIISTGADQIASRMNIAPEFVQAAMNKAGQKIVGERINLNNILKIAVAQVGQQNANTSSGIIPEIEAAEINTDWINNFESEAKPKSTEEMQQLFGRILAGEIQRPSSFSIRTVKLMGQLDMKVAATFRRLCSLCIYLKSGPNVIDARAISLGGNAASNSLQGYGLTFDVLNMLNEHGLIIADYNSWRDYRYSIAEQNNKDANSFVQPFQYQNQQWALVNHGNERRAQEFRLHGVKLSEAGAQLLSIVDIEPVESYTTALHTFFEQQNLQMQPVVIRS